MTPKRHNVEFFVTAAAAQQHGYRACKRCRPDASPGSPEWNVRADVVGRAMRLIADGLVDREGVGGLAARLSYSERQINRLLTAELGAGPLALARAQRAQTARTLIETTSMPITQIAFAAGFASVRQFNDTIREVFASSPSELRGSRQPSAAGGTLSLAPAIPVPISQRVDLPLPRRSRRARHRDVGRGDISTVAATESRQRRRRPVARSDFARAECHRLHLATRQRRRCPGRGTTLPAHARPRCRSRHRRGPLR